MLSPVRSICIGIIYGNLLNMHAFHGLTLRHFFDLSSEYILENKYKFTLYKITCIKRDFYWAFCDLDEVNDELYIVHLSLYKNCSVDLFFTAD